MEKITFCPDGEEPVDFFVLEQTKIAGINYILVTDVEEGDGGVCHLWRPRRTGHGGTCHRPAGGDG